MVSVCVGGARGSHEAAGQEGCHECHCHRVVLYLLLDVQSRASLETVVQVMVGGVFGICYLLKVNLKESCININDRLFSKAVQKSDRISPIKVVTIVLGSRSVHQGMFSRHVLRAKRLFGKPQGRIVIWLPCSVSAS